MSPVRAALLLGTAALLAVGAVIGAAAVLAPAACAQEEPPALIGVPDSVFNTTQRIPFVYSTTYDRAATTASWTQTASWGLSRKWLSISTDAGTNADRNLKTESGRGTSGQINGQMNAMIMPRLVFSVLGQFQSTVPHDILQGALQKRNRIQLRAQYELDPSKTLSMRALVSTEFHRDFDEILRERGDTLALPNQTDKLFLDSLLTSGRSTSRQDGASGQLQWKPGPFQASVTGSASYARPITTIDSTFTGGVVGTTLPARLRFTGTFAEPLTDSRAQGSLGYAGSRGFKIGAVLKTVRTGHIYFAPELGGRENWSLSDRNGALHIEHAPVPGLSYSFDTSISRTFNDFANHVASTNLRRKRVATSTVTWNRSGTLLTGTFDVESTVDERHLDNYGNPDPLQNGETITRFLSGNGSRRLTRRLSVDGVATASLNSYSYVKPTNDQDLARTFLSLGGGYTVSPRCSLTVHFSSNRGFNRYIDASKSAGNNVTSDYQMLAVMNVRASDRLTLTQNYLLSASYRVLDDPNQDSQNTLVRNRRIDTIATDTLFSFAFVRLTHNFLFQDLGPYIHEVLGQDRRYVVSSETYAQTLEAALGVTPMTGVLFLLSQKLGSSHQHNLATGERTISNRWNLTGGLEFNRDIPGGATLQGAVRHIGEYSETPPECQGPNPPASCINFSAQRSDYWIAGVTLQRSF